MVSEDTAAASSTEIVSVINGAGKGRFVIVCDHASNRLLPEYGTLGLAAEQFERHIAWDPGALPVARHLSEMLDAPLVAGGLSRLNIDCNRPIDAPDLIPEISETTVIPGNAGLDAAARQARVELAHVPFHRAVETIVSERIDQGLETCLVSVHSFTPVYKGTARPWHIGILHDEDERLSRPMIAELSATADIVVGDNEPYTPADRVYYTLERHARSRGLPCVMIEIRNDQIRDPKSQRVWGERIAKILSGIQEPDLKLGMEMASNAKGSRRSA